MLRIYLTRSNSTAEKKLLNACKCGLLSAVVTLLEQGVSPDVRFPGDKRKTPLMVASAHGHLPIVQLLLSRGVDVSSVTKVTGMTALHFAAKHGHAAIIDVLVDHGASLDAVSTDGWKPIHYAVAHGHLNAAKALVKRGASLMEPTQKQDYTPLSLACSNKVDSLVRWMIEQQCDVNQSDNTGRTPLHCSAALGDLEMVKILVEEGKALVSLVDHAGNSALDEADKNNMAEVATYLFEKGAESLTTKRSIDALGPLKWYRPRVLNCPEARFSPCITSARSRIFLFGGVGLPRGCINHDPENRLEDRNGSKSPLFHVGHNDFHTLNLDDVRYEYIIPPSCQYRHRNTRLSPTAKGRYIELGPDLLSGEARYEESMDHDYPPCVVKADTPFRREDLFGYFEIQIIQLGTKRILTIGLTDDEFPLENKEPGWIVDSYGLHFDDSMVFHNYGWGKPFADRFQPGDVVGCGINFVTQEIFFTKNGRFLGTAFRGPQKNQYWPTIGVENPGAKFRVNFGAQPFQFSFVVPTLTWHELSIDDVHKPPIMKYAKLFYLPDANAILLIPDHRYLSMHTVWLFDLETMLWRPHQCTGDMPYIHPSSSVCLVRDNFVFIFTPSQESQDASTSCNDTEPSAHHHLFVLNCRTWRWTELMPRILLGSEPMDYWSLFCDLADIDPFSSSSSSSSEDDEDDEDDSDVDSDNVDGSSTDVTETQLTKRLQSLSLQHTKPPILDPDHQERLAQMHSSLFQAACALTENFKNVQMFVVNDSNLLFLSSGNAIVLDTETLKHRAYMVQGARPAALYFSATSVGKNIITFGGWDKVKQQNEVFVLDTETMSWYKPHITGYQVPRPRNSHASVLVTLSHERFATDREELWAFSSLPIDSVPSDSLSISNNAMEVQSNDYSVSPPVFHTHSSYSTTTTNRRPHGAYEPDDLETFLNRKVSDLTFRFPNEASSASNIHAHQIVLICRSSYFKELLATGAAAANTDSKRQTVVIDIDDTQYLVFHCLIKFLYSDVVDTNLLGDSATYRRFIKAAEKYAPEHKNRLVQEFVLTYVSEPSTMSENMRFAFLNPMLSDVSFKIEGYDGTIPAHKAIICSRSSYFRALCMGGLRESREREIKLLDTHYKPFLAILEYLYTRKLDYEKHAEHIVDIFLLACRYDIKRLKHELETVMAFNLSIDNACSLLVLSDQQNAYKLKASCRQWITRNYELVRHSPDYICRRELIDSLLL